MKNIKKFCMLFLSSLLFYSIGIKTQSPVLFCQKFLCNFQSSIFILLNMLFYIIKIRFNSIYEFSLNNDTKFMPYLYSCHFVIVPYNILFQQRPLPGILCRFNLLLPLLEQHHPHEHRKHSVHNFFRPALVQERIAAAVELCVPSGT